MSATVRFVKMSGAGNDFVVVDASDVAGFGSEPAAWTRAVCRRGLSVGADGVLIVGPGPGGRVSVRFLNPDGGEAFCGNGSRCAARHAFRRGWAGPAMVLDTIQGEVAAAIVGRSVRLTLPPPSDRGPLRIAAGGTEHAGRYVVAGVPHFVVPATGLDALAIDRLAAPLRHHAAFGPGGTNVDFVEPGPGGSIRIRTFERGVEGETLACGSGAVASAWVAATASPRGSIVVVPRSGIPLRVGFEGPPNAPTAAILEGDARVVFEGVLDAEALEGSAP